MKIRAAYSTGLVTTLAFSAIAVAQAPAAPAPAAAKPMAVPAAKPPAPMPAMPAGAQMAKQPAMMAPAPAAPAAAPAAPMPAPSKDLEAFMKGFEGHWHCDTKFAAGSMGPGSPEMAAKTTVKIKKEFGGMSWHGEYSLPKSKTMPAMSGVFQIAHDSGSNQATIIGYDSMGSSFLGTGPISGESVTFVEDGFMMGAKTKIRETMAKKSPKEVSHIYEVDMGRGFQPMGEDSCKK